jgi:hypothetical protein
MRFLTLCVILGLPTVTYAAGTCDSNLMIVLDRSCSMQERPGGTGTPTKWEIARQTLGMVTQNFATKLRFGLIMFPDQTGGMAGYCQQDGPIYVNVGPNKGPDVIRAVSTTQPNGPCVTDIDAAMGQVASDPEYMATTPQPGRRGYVLLLTDGMQSDSCGGLALDVVTIMNIENLYAHGYPTFVVGYGGEVSATSLDSFAAAGGVPRSGMPRYYQADTPAELQAVLLTIAGSIGGDEFNCPGTPCPDGRCFGQGEVCNQGTCVIPGENGGHGGAGGVTGFGGSGGTGGAGVDAATADAADDTGGHASGQPACACQLGARVPSGMGGLALLWVAAGLVTAWGRSSRYRRRS